MDDQNIFIHRKLSIPLRELKFKYSSSGGPGGQHVNRTATKAELLFSVTFSDSLSDYQKHKILKFLSSSIDKEGILHLVSAKTRSQTQNREDVILRFQELLREALKTRKARRPTKPTKASKEKRLYSKKKKSDLKRQRRKPDLE